jgi:hypothetical protein
VRNLMGRFVLPLLLIAAASASARAQDASGPFVRLPTLLLSATPARTMSGNLLAIDGDVALVKTATGAIVLERGGQGDDSWREVAQLPAPGDGSRPDASFLSVALSDHTALVGAGGEVAIFERNHGGDDAWGLVTTLTPDDPTASLDALAISGDTVVVTQATDIAGGARSVRIFQQHCGSRNAWGEVTRLTSPNADALSDGFGWSLAISGDTLLVGETQGPAAGGGRVLVYERHHRGPEAWQLVTTLEPITDFGAPISSGFGWRLSLSGDTAVALSGEVETGLYIFERDRRGGDHWTETRAFLVGCCTNNAALSGDTLVVTSRVVQEARMYARNQGEADGWGQVAAFRGTGGEGFGGGGGLPVAISKDTVLLIPRTGPEGPEAIHVFVSDVDGDGLRDALDPCPRDPLNDRHCHRDVIASPAVDDILRVDDIQTTAAGRNTVITESVTNTS